MASIIFDSSLDNSKLEAGIKQSNKSFGELAKSGEKAGIAIDQAIAKTTKNTKEAVKEQQALIKSLEEDIKRIETLVTSATPVAKNKGLFEELSRMKENLATEQGKLNELQNTGIKQDAKEEVSKNKIIESLKKWGIGLFTVGAALKIAKDIINSTEGSADKFKETVALVTGGLQGLYRTMVTGTWDQLINNIVNAARATRDLKIATSELEHITAGGIIKRADLLSELERARVRAAETINPVERAKYLNEAIDYQKQITELNIGEIKKRLAIDEDYYFKLTGHSKEYYDYLLKQIPNIAKDYETFYSQQEGYQIRLNQLKYLASAQSGGLTNAQEKERHELQLMVLTLEDYKILQEDLSKKGQWDEYIKGIGEMRAEVARGDQALVYLTRQATTAGKAGVAAAEAALGIKNEIEALKAESIDFGSAATDKGIKKELLLISNKYKEDLIKYKDNEEAKLLLEERYTIERLNIQKKYNSEIAKSAGELDPGKGYSILNRAVNRPDSGPNVIGGKNETLSLEEMWKLRKQNDEVIAKNKKDNAAQAKDAKGDLKDELDLRNEIVQAAANLINQIGQQIGLDEKSMALLNAGLDAFTALATKGAAGIPEAAMAMVLGIIKQIPSAASRFEAQIAHINQLLAEQQRLIALSERKGNQEQLRKDNLETLQQEERIAKAEADRLQKSADSHVDLLGWRQDKADKEKQSWQEITVAIEEANQALDDFNRGGITENIIADSIAQGFRDGKTSVDDFGNYMNTVLLDAVMNIFKQNILGSPLMKDYLGYTTQVLSDNVLSQDDIDILNKKGKEFSDAMKPTWDALAGGLDLMGGAATANTGLSGQIARNITEDTASELTGLFRRFADDQRVVKDYSILGVNHLVGIENNTAQTVVQLQLAVVELKSIVSNTKQVPVGAL